MKCKQVLVYLVMPFLILVCSSGCRKEEQPEFKIPSISCSILTEQPITIGGPIDIALIVYHEKGDDVIFPEEDKLFLPFTLKNTLMKTRRVKGNIFKTMVIYTVTIFQIGNFKLNPFEVKIRDKVLKTEPLDISILSVLPKNDETPTLKDILPPYSARMRPFMYIIIPLSLIGAAVLFYFIYRILLRRKGEELELIHAEKPIDPFKYSIRELIKLKKALIENLSDTKSTYSIMSWVLRFFIGAVLNFSAPQMTTNEIKRYIRRRNETQVPLPRVINILKRSDMVKFAKERPQKPQIKNDIDESIDIIEEVHNSATNEKEANNTDDV